MNTHDPRSRFLTRTDLDQLEIPTESILQWLTDGSLEQLTLLNLDDGAEAVYAVHSPALAEDLEQGLRRLGKPEVRLDPAHAQAELQNVLMVDPDDEGAVEAERDPAASATSAPARPIPTPDGQDPPPNGSGPWCELPDLRDDDLFRHVTAEEPTARRTPEHPDPQSTRDFRDDEEVTQPTIQEAGSILVDVQDALDSLLSPNPEPAVEGDSAQLASLMADPPGPAPTDQLAEVAEPAPADDWPAQADGLADIDEPAPADQLAEVAEPVPADDWPAQADGLADIDEPAPADQLAEVDEPVPADWPAQADGLADIDEPAPTDQLADLDEPAPTDQLADIDEPAPADQLAEVDEPAPADDSPAQADGLADIDEPTPTDQLAEVAEPVPADWPAQADGLADVDEPAPADQLAEVDEPTPADQLAEVDEPAPADDSPAQADELADIDEPAPADQLADVDEPARIGGATVLTDDAETAESLLPEDQVDRTDEGDPATPAEAPVVAASDGESARAVVETAEDPAFTEDDAPSAGVRTVEPKTDPVATQVSDQARPESPPADRPGRQSADARVEVQRAAGPELSVTPGQDSSSDRQPIDQLAAGPLVDLEPLAEPMRQIDLTVRMLAERPAPVADLTALTQAVETGFQTLQEGLSQSPLLHSVDDRLQQVQETLDQLGEVGSRPAVAMPATNGPQVQRPNGSYGPSTSRIVAAGVMLLGWIAVLWFHTGDAKIAISGVIAVNLIGCLLLSGRTDGDRG